MKETNVAFDNSRFSFDTYFDSEIAPKLSDMEKYRRRRIRLTILLGIAGLLLIGAAVFAELLSNTDGNSILQLRGLASGDISLITFLAGLGALFGAFFAYSSVYDQYKKVLTGSVCIFLGFDYQLKKFEFPVHAFDPIIPEYDSVRLEDRISGQHEGVEFVLCEGRFSCSRGGQNEKSREFRWLMLSFSFPKPFQSETIITGDWGFSSGTLLERLRQEGEPVRLESMEFEERFEAYSTDPLAAYQLLTPKFIERVMSLADRLDARKTLRLAYRDNRLLIALKVNSVANWFESGHVFKSPDGKQNAQKVFEDLRLIPMLIDGLDLSTARSRSTADADL